MKVSEYLADKLAEIKNVQSTGLTHGESHAPAGADSLSPYYATKAEFTALADTVDADALAVLVQEVEGLPGDLAAHMAETMSEVIVAQRDISITGVQTISTSKRVKSAVCFASISANVARSNGVLAEDGTQRAVGIRGYDNTTSLQNAFVNIMTTSASVFALGVVENITDSSFDIRWTNNNSPIGTVTMYILLQYHGGDV